MPPKEIKECGKGTRRERERKGKEEKRDKKKERGLNIHSDKRQSDSSRQVKALDASPVPTCRRDIQVHSICLHLLNFSQLPSCLC